MSARCWSVALEARKCVALEARKRAAALEARKRAAALEARKRAVTLEAQVISCAGEYLRAKVPGCGASPC